MGREVKKYDWEMTLDSQLQVLDGLCTKVSTHLEADKLKESRNNIKSSQMNNDVKNKQYRKLYKKVCNLTNELVKK